MLQDSSNKSNALGYDGWMMMMPMVYGEEI